MLKSTQGKQEESETVLISAEQPDNMSCQLEHVDFINLFAENIDHKHFRVYVAAKTCDLHNKAEHRHYKSLPGELAIRTGAALKGNPHF